MLPGGLPPLPDPRTFTSTLNFTNFLCFFIRGARESTALWLWCVPLLLPGVNEAVTVALKGASVDKATADGFGKGEFSGWQYNLRAVSAAIGPFLMGHWYAMTYQSKIQYMRGSVFAFAGVIGAVIPQIILACTTDEELKPPTKEEK